MIGGSLLASGCNGVLRLIGASLSASGCNGVLNMTGFHYFVPDKDGNMGRPTALSFSIGAVTGY